MSNLANGAGHGEGTAQPATLVRSNSISHASEASETAADFIRNQIQLEADAREALPYQFDECTKPLGPLRQTLFSCLTCNPRPANPADAYNPAGLCYACSISCHGEHELVELFTKRNFVCDCGTTRLPATSPCTLRVNEATGRKGDVHSEEPAPTNRYNQNFQNRFCGCGGDYDPHSETGTMFQCLGLGTVEEGGCGEDWWHPECVIGLDREQYKKDIEAAKLAKTNKTRTEQALGTIAEEPTEDGVSREPQDTEENINDATSGRSQAEAGELEDTDEDPPLPPGFPQEDEFEAFLCYKCTEAFPWIKRYAGADGFLPPVFYRPNPSAEALEDDEAPKNGEDPTITTDDSSSRKRKASEDPDGGASQKRQKSVDPSSNPASDRDASASAPATCKLPPAGENTARRLSLFLRADFRDHLCRCIDCFPKLKPHPQLLEEEETYEPPVSEDGSQVGGQSAGTGSLLDRGEAAFSNMDRVQAIEGALAYAHLKDAVKNFLKPFAESGKAVGAEDIKAYFEKLRGDSEAIKQAAAGAQGGRDDGAGDSRKEQGGY